MFMLSVFFQKNNYLLSDNELQSNSREQYHASGIETTETDRNSVGLFKGLFNLIFVVVFEYNLTAV